LVERLRARRLEIEQAVLTRVYAISDPRQTKDPTYAEGLRTAVSAAIDFGLHTIEHGEEGMQPIPGALIVQARVAARDEVSLDTVLRRYFAGYTLLGDILIEEAERGDLVDGAELQRLLRMQAALFDSLLADISEEYSRASSGRPVTVEQRRAQRVKRLLDGELLDTTALGYDFDAWHLGAVASGSHADKAIHAAAERMGCRLLLLRKSEQTVWAWLGSQRSIASTELERALNAHTLAGVKLAVGEPGENIAGWRRTHRQAATAFPVILHQPGSVVRYVEVALVASIIRDELLVSSLYELYLAPLEQERDGGEGARQTLRAYFKADRNLSSAAAQLGISRRTVANRLRASEERIGRSLKANAVEVEVALRLENLDKTSPTG